MEEVHKIMRAERKVRKMLYFVEEGVSVADIDWTLDMTWIGH